MILGLGLDVVSLPDFQKRLEDPFFVESVFTQAEQAYAAALPGTLRQQHALAGRYAAKEAFIKAASQAATVLGTPQPVGGMLDIEVQGDNHHPPRFHLSETLEGWAARLGLGTPLLSISHDGPVVGAVVIIARQK